MAFQYKGNVFFSNERSLVDVNKAGITTALLLGPEGAETFTVDGQTGIATGTQLELNTSLQIAGGVVVNAVLDEDDMSSDSATAIPTQQSVKAFVEGFTSGGGGSIDAGDVTANTVLAKSTLTVGEGTVGTDALQVNGTTGDLQGVTATFSGLVNGANVVLTGDMEAATANITGQLDADSAVIANGLGAGSANITGALSGDAITAGTSLQIGASTLINGILDEDDLASDSDTSVPTQQSVKKYIDDEIASVNGAAAAAKLNIAGDSGADADGVNLTNDTLSIVGSTNEIETLVTDNQIEVSLRSDVTISNSLTVGSGGLDASAGALSADSAVINNAAQVGSLTFNGTESANALLRSSGTPATPAIDATATNEELPSAAAVYEYVNNQVSANNQLMFIGDDFGTSSEKGMIDLADEDLLFAGAANQIVTDVDAANGNTINFALRDDVKIATSLIVGEAQGASGADLFAIDNTNNEVIVDGTVKATDFNSTSDIRKKENIVEIEGALEKVNALRGVLFDWKDGSGASGGIIAQEVEEVLPSLVKEGEHKTVIYNGLIGLLIQAVKEMSAEIEELKSAK